MQELQETWVRSLGQEDPLEEEMATHSSILVWRIPWILAGAWQVWGHKESDMTEHVTLKGIWLENLNPVLSAWGSLESWPM